MTYTKVLHQPTLDRAYKTLLSIIRKGSQVCRNANIGFHSGNITTSVAWNPQMGIWVMIGSQRWDKTLLVLGTQNPFFHKHRSLNITCQINVSPSALGRQRSGAILSKGKALYLAHNGGVGGGKKGIGKSAFLEWYQRNRAAPVAVPDLNGHPAPYIIITKIASSGVVLDGLARFVHDVALFKHEAAPAKSLADQLKEDAKKADDEGAFDPGNPDESKHKTLRAINLRRGQAAFRKKLLAAYSGRCAVSGCDCREVLEAAHIRNYGGQNTNHTQNGLLLRADIHTLFDLGKLGIRPNDHTVVIAKELLRTSYATLAGKQVRLPSQESQRPNPEVLREHLRLWKLRGK